MKKITQKIGQQVAKMSLGMTKMNVNSACWIIVHQPKLPANANKLRKF